MSKMSIDLARVEFEGPVMGTRWSADLGLPSGTDPKAVEAALAAAVAQVDAQMSTWKPDSDLMRLNRAPVGDWVEIPRELMQVLARALEIGRASDGAFDIGLGDLVSAWGFGGDAPDTAAIRANLGRARAPSHDGLELDQAGLRVRKLIPLTLDLSGIAKGYGVDRMMQVCDDFAIPSALVALDGELRAKGTQPDGTPWSVAIEKPDYKAREALSMLELQDVAVATSGDYRHWVDISKSRFSHSMDRRMGGPAQPGIASVTVLAADCMTADAMATAVLVMGVAHGSDFARELGLDCLIIERTPGGLVQHGVGPLFGA
ncbi:MAG: thiamine biosynthesis protein ApbE [Rhodobacteraceae bacterium]|nr:MAG: thiamine biosynthesis protein ApbE [Paracoccaceae bacterium]